MKVTLKRTKLLTSFIFTDSTNLWSLNTTILVNHSPAAMVLRLDTSLTLSTILLTTLPPPHALLTKLLNPSLSLLGPIETTNQHSRTRPDSLSLSLRDSLDSVKTPTLELKHLTSSVVVTLWTDNTGMVVAGAPRRMLTPTRWEPVTEMDSTSPSLSTRLSYAITMEDSSARSASSMLVTSE
jgi:hypothetical protein